MSRRGTPSALASHATSASFARPSIGGAARRTRSAPSCRPSTSVRFALGTTDRRNATASPRANKQGQRRLSFMRPRNRLSSPRERKGPAEAGRRSPKEREPQGWWPVGKGQAAAGLSAVWAAGAGADAAGAAGVSGADFLPAAFFAGAFFAAAFFAGAFFAAA